MFAVIYGPDEKIVQRVAGGRDTVEATAEAMGLAWLEVPDDGPYDLTHRVVDGELVPDVA